MPFAHIQYEHGAPPYIPEFVGCETSVNMPQIVYVMHMIGIITQINKRQESLKNWSDRFAQPV
jgi:hypothetical protein